MKIYFYKHDLLKLVYWRYLLNDLYANQSKSSFMRMTDFLVSKYDFVNSSYQTEAAQKTVCLAAKIIAWLHYEKFSASKMIKIINNEMLLLSKKFQLLNDIDKKKICRQIAIHAVFLINLKNDTILNEDFLSRFCTFINLTNEELQALYTEFKANLFNETGIDEDEICLIETDFDPGEMDFINWRNFSKHKSKIYKFLSNLVPKQHISKFLQ